MKKIKILDKKFEIFINKKEIENAINKIANQLNEDYKDKEVIFLGILNGSFMFASDLFKKLKIKAKITFLKLASYDGASSTGKVKRLIGINEVIENKNLIILEDIVDTGITIDHIIRQLKGYEPKEIKIASFLYKPDSDKKKIPIDYIGIEIPNDLGLSFEKNGAGNDMLICLLTAIRYPYFGYISEPLAHFRAHEGSISCSNDISLYRRASKKYFVDNFINDRDLIKAFYSQMWLASLKHKGKYNQLVKKEEINMLAVFKELINYLRKKFKFSKDVFRKAC